MALNLPSLFIDFHVAQKIGRWVLPAEQGTKLMYRVVPGCDATSVGCRMLDLDRLGGSRIQHK